MFLLINVDLMTLNSFSLARQPFTFSTSTKLLKDKFHLGLSFFKCTSWYNYSNYKDLSDLDHQIMKMRVRTFGVLIKNALSKTETVNSLHCSLV